MRSALLLLMLALHFSPSVAFAQNSKPKGLREIGLGDFQLKTLSGDFPIQDFAITTDGSKNVLLGQKHLWVWELEKQKLQKLDFAKDDGVPQKIEVIDDKWAIAFDDHVFNMIRLDQLAVFSVAAPQEGFSVGTTIKNGNIFWLHSSGVYAVSLDSQKLQQVAPGGLFSQEDKGYYDHDRRALWIVRNEKVLIRDLADGKVKTRLAHKGTQPFRAIASFKNEILINNLYTVLRFAEDGSLKAAIPVESQRQLVTMDIESRQHAYFFQDGLLQIFNLDRQAHTDYRLKGVNATRISRLNVVGPLVGVLEKGEPHIYLAE